MTEIEEILRVENLRKVYGKKIAIDTISFSINRGEIVGLIGPNGAGKSTIMKSLVGIIPIYEGTIRTFPKTSGVFYGAVIEEPGFYEEESGRYNLEYLSRGSRVCDFEVMDKYVKLLDMEHAMDQKVKGYSLGMKQRLGIIQALMNHQEFLILDEPTNGLDPVGVSELRALIHTLAKEGITILISSHILKEIEAICDRFIMIQNGQIVDSFSRQEIGEAILKIKVKKNEIYDQSISMDYICTEEEESIDFKYFLLEKVKEEEIPKLIQTLVERNIGIYSVEYHTSLEKRFMKNVEEGV